MLKVVTTSNCADFYLVKDMQLPTTHSEFGMCMQELFHGKQIYFLAIVMWTAYEFHVDKVGNVTGWLVLCAKLGHVKHNVCD